MEAESSPLSNLPSPSSATTEAELENRLHALSPEVRPDPALVGWLKEEVDAYGEALAIARTLADAGEGHYPLRYNPLIISTTLNHLNEARGVARLLQKDAIARAEAGDVDGAVDSSRAILGVGRSIGDEPFLISQLVRFALESLAVQSFQREIAQGRPSASALARMQAALADEEAKPLLLIALRGERAGSFDMLDKLSSGSVSPSALTGATGPGATMLPLQFGPFGRYNQGLALDMMNQAVAIAGRPLPEQADAWTKLEGEMRPAGGLMRYLGALAYLLLPSNESVAQAFQRTRAVLRSAEAMAACERYRIDHGRWPANLEALTPNYLAKVPEDPYDGQPLRFRRAEGVVFIYAVGPDLKDDGAKYHPRGAALPGFDVRCPPLGPRPSPPAEPAGGASRGRLRPVRPVAESHARHHPHVRRPADPVRPDRQARPAPVARRPRPPGGPLGRPEADAHLTLAFLGEVDHADLASVCRAVAEASAPFSPFELRIRGLGAFPDPARPRVVWAGIEGDLETLGALQRALVSGLSKAGYRPADDRFHPHVTLGRVKGGRGPSPDLRPPVRRFKATLGWNSWRPFAASEAVSYVPRPSTPKAPITTPWRRSP